MSYRKKSAFSSISAKERQALVKCTGKAISEQSQKIRPGQCARECEWLPEGTHIEIARGSECSNIKYCSKLETRVDGEEPHTFGIPAEETRGRRSDLIDLIESVTNGGSLEVIAEKHPSSFIRYNRGIRDLISVRMKVRSEMPKFVFITGPPGVGKSKEAFDTESVYSKPRGQWWDGYSQQKRIVFDDYRPSDYPTEELLRVIDRYPMRVPIKGGYIELNSPEIYITSNLTFEQCFTADANALRSRLDRGNGKIIDYYCSQRE